MAFKNFRFNVGVRIVLLSLTLIFFFYFLIDTDLYATTALTGFVIVVQVVSLMRLIERTNRDLVRFLQSIKYADFSQTFGVTLHGKSFDDLNAAFNDVMAEFREARSKTEEQYRYLQTVVQHVGIGLIAFKDSGEIELINNAAKKLLRNTILYGNGIAGETESPSGSMRSEAEFSVRNIKNLEEKNKQFVDTLFRLRSGEKEIIKLDTPYERLQLAAFAVEFKLRSEKYKLVSLQNIRRELEEKEMEAWQNLIRVLTHEIMNSVTPIASLASTGNDLIRGIGAQEGERVDIATDLLDDLRSAFLTIEKRGEGLLHFVNAYRNLTRIPKPNFHITGVASLFERVIKLMKTQIPGSSIRIVSRVEPESLELTADPELIEQVLINLLKNSIEALDGKQGGTIRLFAGLDNRGRVVVTVQDNGPGILTDALDKIFIPFYTTKESGSGVGLSLTRQIMRLHGGFVSVRSKPGEETVFTLRF